MWELDETIEWVDERPLWLRAWQGFVDLACLTGEVILVTLIIGVVGIISSIGMLLAVIYLMQATAFIWVR
jgi:uncharacterized RDD family membrane protein YckC